MLKTRIASASYTGEDIAAVILEPIQGEGGVIIPPDDYFRQVREICDRCGVILIVDEVQTGLGRTGRLFGIEPPLVITKAELDKVLEILNKVFANVSRKFSAKP